jgi:hypothetical protein
MIKRPWIEIMNHSSWVVPLCAISSLVTPFISGHCTKSVVFQFVYSGLYNQSRYLYFVI